MNVYLTEPTIDLQEEYLEFYQEWKNSGETMVPWVIAKDPSNFPEMIQELLDASEGKNLRKGWVPDSTYWLIANNKKIIGAVNIRHQLTEHLFNAGGHIGYGIRPSARQKGFATKLLALSLEKIKELDVTKVLVVCDEWNVASEKTILHNGGLRDNDFVEADGNVVRRYWIEL
ncbi:GNAT family N-acetyltransferase [Bacillus sp. Xin]|uniref:GNAT family N-acetyltransferase n=1 Tax=unclassified Bacillus (in: firmicutes) TaxID=185979 RepID=UPI0015749109|nr:MULTISPECIES: GNAT family N-acetyltransferase [unclassified Bacillus (in: firmicutes)]MBC6972821.1 GNAT family N-acetyltransferase [Bacillus sp. Xin]NSW37230.1 GNAT family N-acetyltransferase [Bacillus sp. Xin1]